MKYDFTSIIDRHGKDAVAVDGIGKDVWGISPGAAKKGFDEIPMWVADMNFATAPSVTEELKKRVEHPLYGYFQATDEYYDSIIRWQTERHGYKDLSREEIGYENGVHGCISSAIRLFTEPGDAVLLHSPAYVGFIGDLHESGRRIVYSDLVKDEENVWRMDFSDMEEKIRANHIRLVIFCSPHNPTGRVWERWELEQALDIFRRNHCIVLSDEIWSDIVFEGHRHLPTACVNEDAASRTISIYAPSKTFNLAGLVGSYHIIRNPYLRERLETYSENTHYNDVNVLSMHALIGAYKKEGGEWTDELNQVLEKNCRYVTDFINGKQNGLRISMPEGTYMLFMDCREYLREHHLSLEEFLRKGWDVGVAWQDGRQFHDPCSIRMNTALPFTKIQEAMERLERYVL